MCILSQFPGEDLSKGFDKAAPAARHVHKAFDAFRTETRSRGTFEVPRNRFDAGAFLTSTISLPGWAETTLPSSCVPPVSMIEMLRRITFGADLPHSRWRVHSSVIAAECQQERITGGAATLRGRVRMERFFTVVKMGLLFVFSCSPRLKHLFVP